MLAQFDDLAAEAGVHLRLADLLPTILPGRASAAGKLTEAGARLLDPSGTLRPGVRCAHPRVTPARGWWPPTRSRRAPATSAPAPASSRWSCSSTSSAGSTASWTWSPRRPATWWRWCTATTAPANSTPGSVFSPSSPALGVAADNSAIFETLFRSALDGAPDGGGLLAYNYLSGEPITGLEEGRPLFLRTPDSTFDLATFMRTQLYASLATLRIGMDVLQKDENVRLDTHVRPRRPVQDQGRRPAASWPPRSTPRSRSVRSPPRAAPGASLSSPPSSPPDPRQSLADYLNTQVFADAASTRSSPTRPTWPASTPSSQRYLEALPVQRAAVEHT